MRACQKRRINMMRHELMQISKIRICHNKYRFCVEEDRPNISDAINIVDINLITNKIICSCNDAKSYNNLHPQIICKHGCFVLIKVLEIFTDESYFFTNMTFTNEDIAIIPDKLSNLHPSLITNEYDNLDHLFNMYDDENSDSETDHSDSDISSLIQQTNLELSNVERFMINNDDELSEIYISKLSPKLKKKIITKTEKKLFADTEICPVCFEKLNETSVIKCSNCNNYVHVDCLEKWLSNNNSCILCRINIKEDLLQNINSKHICECGSTFFSSYIKKHLLTKKHLNFIASTNVSQQ